jgi:hypothetical protein
VIIRPIRQIRGKNQTNFAPLRLSEQNQITIAQDHKKNAPKKQGASWRHLK